MYGREDQRDDRAFRSSHLLATKILLLATAEEATQSGQASLNYKVISMT
jgi:hypothetical protein